MRWNCLFLCNSWIFHRISKIKCSPMVSEQGLHAQAVRHNYVYITEYLWSQAYYKKCLNHVPLKSFPLYARFTHK